MDSKEEVQKRLVEIAGGVLIEEDVLGIVERIQQYDTNLIVQFCNPDKAEFSDAPYRVLERCPDGFIRPVMEVWNLDQRVIDRLHSADTHSHNILSDLDKWNKKATDLGKRRYCEEVDAVSEMVRGVLKSPKDTYTATNPVTDESHKFTSLKKSD